MAQPTPFDQRPPALNDRIDCNGWLGGSYPTRSLAVDAERTINLYPEYVTPGEGKTKMALYGTPGLNVFVPSLGSGGLNSGIYSLTASGTEHMFVSSGTGLYEVYADGTFTLRGAIASNQPVHFSDDGRGSLALATGSGFYVYNVATHALVSVTTVNGDAIIASDVEFIDGYFFALITGTNMVRSSEPDQPLVWNDLSFTVKDGASDPAIGLAADHLQLWIMGSATIEIYYNAGNPPPGFPFDRVQGGFVQQGLVAPSTVLEMADGLFWLGRADNGEALVYRNSGYSAIRISTHALEAAMNSYPNLADTVASTYLQEGHNFFRLDFPSANGGYGATWVYDTATQLWHERLYWNSDLAAWTINPARFICYAFGKYLTATYAGDQVFEQTLDALTDNGNIIRRQRISAPLADHMNWHQYHEFQLDMQMGVGVPEEGDGSDPVAVLRFSDDGGYTWSNEITTALGKTGETKARALWRRLGKSRDRVFEVTITEPIQMAIVNAYVRVSPGNGS